MTISTAAAIAHPNIAFIKYWGNQNDALRLPANGSISMNLGDLTTRTVVTFDSSLPHDIFDLNNQRQSNAALVRVVEHLNLIRGIRGMSTRAHILSETNVPIGSGVASSSAAFAALTVAAVRAMGIEMREKDLSRLARRGSGSACRSIPEGFVEWLKGQADTDSFAVSIARKNAWELVDCIAILDRKEKKTGSTEGHKIASTSPLQGARVLDSSRRLERCKSAILQKDFSLLAETIEQDALLMHSIMMTSNPALFYWQPATIEVIEHVIAWRKLGHACAFTIDAGPNVHVICEIQNADFIQEHLKSLACVKEVLVSSPGGAAHLV